MAEVIMTNKQQRVRCTDEKFLEAVYTSKNYHEIAEKTGQKVASTMARYTRVKKMLAEKGIDLPEMERKKPIRTEDAINNMVEIVKRLKAHHSES